MGSEMISAAVVCIVITLVGLSFRLWSSKITRRVILLLSFCCCLPLLR